MDRCKFTRSALIYHRMLWNDPTMPGSIHAHVADGTRLTVAVVSDQGATLTLSGDITDLDPTIESGGVLQTNPALLSNMWAYAKAWYVARTTSYSEALAASDRESEKAALKQAEENKKSAQKRADGYAKVAQWIADLAATRHVTPSQVALAWVIRHPFIAAIPGASSVGQLEANVAAADLKLTGDEIAALETAADRYRPITGLAAMPALATSLWRARRR